MAIARSTHNVHLKGHFCRSFLVLIEEEHQAAFYPENLCCASEEGALKSSREAKILPLNERASPGLTAGGAVVLMDVHEGVRRDA